MSHTKYTTEGIVMAGSDVGEADRYLELFTKDLGLVGAHARGVRKLDSKHRFGLQPLSRSNLSLVRGRRAWRITNVVPHDTLYGTLRHDPVKLSAFVRVLGLVRRLVRGEELNSTLFSIVENGFEYMSTHALSHKDILCVETLLVLRILHNLGYLKHKEHFAPLIAHTSINETIVEKTRKVRREAVAEINRTLEASQM